MKDRYSLVVLPGDGIGIEDDEIGVTGGEAAQSPERTLSKGFPFEDDDSLKRG